MIGQKLLDILEKEGVDTSAVVQNPSMATPLATVVLENETRTIFYTTTDFTKQVNEKGKEASKVTLKFCPDHYRVYMEEVIPAMPLKYRILTKIALKLGAIQVEQLKYMESELCFYCKFGSGGHEKKAELPPM